MPRTSASGNRGLIAAIVVLALVCTGLLAWTVGGKLLQKPSQTDTGTLIQAPGQSGPGSLVQAPQASTPSTMVQAPAQSQPQPVIQAPTGPAPDNSDIDDYLKFVREIELTKQDLIHKELAAALSTYGNETAESIKGATDDEDAKTFLPKINQDSDHLADDWNKLTGKFNERTPPQSCIDLRNKYLDHLAKVQGMFVQVHTALQEAQTDTSKALSSLTGMLGTASTEADSTALAADDALADVCKRYNLSKDFSIKTDAGSAALLH